MRKEHISTANYAAVIADLRTKRDEIDRTIAMLEAMMPRRAAAPSAPPVQPEAPGASESQPTVKATGNNGIGEACANIVRTHAGRELSTRDVTDLLITSGFEINTANPVNNVWSALNQRAKTAKDIERVGKKWRYAGRPEKVSLPAETAHMNGAANQV
jgi:hypothetical protein